MTLLLRFFGFGLNHPLRRPVLTLGFASICGCGLLAARVLIAGNWRHLYLPWNLLLAWMPLLFALAAGRIEQEGKSRRWRFFAAAFAWLMFFPNAPYIFTDLIHLGPRSYAHFWADLVLILVFALTGLVLGFLSLFLMQRQVARRFGWPVSWLFVGGVAGLSGFGIYIGRFLRWNSWDVLLNPFGLFADIWQWFAGIPSRPALAAIPALFATLLFTAYLMLYALTHLPSGWTQPVSGEEHQRHD
jgi:uncharacterized membrane protein